MSVKQSVLKSVASTAVLPRRPVPPARLSKHARTLWRSITSEYSPDHFGGANLVLLESFCRSADEIRQYDELVNQEGLFIDGAPHPAVAVRRVTVSQLASLAVKLRISISATIRAEAKEARRDAHLALRKPWQS